MPGTNLGFLRSAARAEGYFQAKFLRRLTGPSLTSIGATALVAAVQCRQFVVGLRGIHVIDPLGPARSIDLPFV